MAYASPQDKIDSMGNKSSTPIAKMLFLVTLYICLTSPKVEDSRYVFHLFFFVRLDCPLAAYVKIGYSNASVPVWSTQISIHQLLQFVTATDNFPDREEEGFLYDFCRPSAGLLSAAVFVFLPRSCCTICLLFLLGTERQNKYKGQERERFSISFPSP